MFTKKRVYLLIGFCCVCLLLLNISRFVGGDVSNVKKEILGPSSKYSEKDINRAMDKVITVFDLEYYGCKMTRIWFDPEFSDPYLGDESYSNQEVIVILSSFDTGPKAPSGFNTNDSYVRWSWILVRTSSMGSWKLVDWGQG